MSKPTLSTNRKLLRWWLFVVLVAIAALVIVGGATRMTDSGLSITEWKPIHGVIPPLSEAEWQEELELYKAIPEYEQVNKGMTLHEFKFIYWWEWTHRLLARSVGILFAVPLAFFWLTGRVESRLKLPLLGILALGGLQGFVGWWMVASGLVERIDVSQYRLATHLTLACIIFAAIVWVWRGLGRHSGDSAPTPSSPAFAGTIACLILIQIYLGGLVAGLKAGLTSNTWPLMDGKFIPDGLFIMTPWAVNLFENALTVQFDHRMVAYLIWILAGWHMIASLRAAPSTTHARRSVVLFGLVTIQAILGILTLLFHVPMDLALTHQTVALLLLGFAIAHWRGFHGSYSYTKKELAAA